MFAGQVAEIMSTRVTWNSCPEALEPVAPEPLAPALGAPLLAAELLSDEGLLAELVEPELLLLAAFVPADALD